MSTTLRPRTFKAYAVVEALRNGSEDIRGAVVPFLHPLLAFMNGRILNTAQLADAVNESYAWNVSSDVIEGLIPQFLESGWVEPVETNDRTAAYRVTCHLPDGTFYSDLTGDLKRLEEEFCQYAEDQSSLFVKDRSREDLLSLLLRWVVSLDVYDAEQLRRSVDVENGGGAGESLSASRRFSTDEHFICASFTKHIHTTKSPLIDTLGHVVRVGLLAEAAEDFARPTTAVKRTTLAVYLDGPVAMDLLNISGKEAYHNIRTLTDRVKALGGSLRVFDDSIEEIQRNLRAMFRRPSPQRTGPTATAIRKREVLESYVQEVQARPVPALERAGVQVVSRSLGQFPNEHKYFDQECYRDLYSQIQWHVEDAPRAHDALVVTNIMRMRRGVQTTDLFETGHVLVTRNAPLASAARRIARERGRLNRYSIGPVIHQRQLATAVWLRAGLSSAEKKTIPIHLLLASCERVLQLRPDVIQKARHIAQSRGPETAEQLDLLLTVDRSTQVLMERTLNTASVVDEGRFDDILQSMRESLIAEKTAEFETTIEAARREAEEARNKLQADAEREAASLKSEVSEAQEIATQTQAELQSLATEDNLAVEALLGYISEVICRRRQRASRMMFGAVIAIDLILLTITVLFPSPAPVLLFVIALLTTLPHVLDKIQAFTKFGIVSEDVAWTMLWVEAEKRGISPKMSRVELEFAGQGFSRKFLPAPAAAPGPEPITP